MKNKTRMIATRLTEAQWQQLEIELRGARASDFFRDALAYRIEHGTPLDEILREVKAIREILEGQK